MTAVRIHRRLRFPLIAALAAVVVAIPTIVVGAQAVGRGPSGVVVVPAAQSPSHFASVAGSRVGARDSLIPAGAAAAVAHQRRLVQSVMLDFTTASPETLDMRGIEPSLYKGDFFDPAAEPKRQCIVKRESEGQYDVRGGGGNKYFGAYQMSDALADGATHMMLKEHKRILGVDEAKKLMMELRETPVNQWPRYWQDAAFSTIFNWEASGSGASHWAGGRWHC